MSHISQKVCRLGNIRNGVCFRPVFDSDGLSTLLTYVRVRGSKHKVLCFEESWEASYFLLSGEILVRRVISTE